MKLRWWLWGVLWNLLYIYAIFLTPAFLLILLSFQDFIDDVIASPKAALHLAIVFIAITTIFAVISTIEDLFYMAHRYGS